MIWADIAVCMSISMLLSFWASHKFEGPRVRLLCFFLVALVSLVLFGILGGVLTAIFPDQSQPILTSVREETWTAIGGIFVMAYFGMWRLPKIIAEGNERRRDQTQ